MEYKNLENTLDEYGERIVKGMKNILIRNKKRASGNLINSIDYDFKYINNEPTLEMEYAPYGKFVDGVERDTGKHFIPRWKKGYGPPVKEIIKWLKMKNIPYTYKGKGEKPSRDVLIKNHAFAIVNKIAERKTLASKPVYFTKPYDDIIGSKKYTDDVRIALQRDVNEEIKKRFYK